MMGYSAQVSANLRIGDTALTVAKTNGATMSLAEPSTIEVPEYSRAVLTITVDGDDSAREVILVEGVKVGQELVRYATEAKGW